MSNHPEPLSAHAAVLAADAERGIDVWSVEYALSPPCAAAHEPAPFIIDPPPWSEHYRGDD